MIKKNISDILLSAFAIASLALLLNVSQDSEKAKNVKVSALKNSTSFKMPVAHSGGSY